MAGLKFSRSKWKVTNKTGLVRVNGSINARSLRKDTPLLFNKSKTQTQNSNKPRLNTLKRKINLKLSKRLMGRKSK
jgi:hypothetical protein